MLGGIDSDLHDVHVRSRCIAPAMIHKCEIAHIESKCHEFIHCSAANEPDSLRLNMLGNFPNPHLGMDSTNLSFASIPTLYQCWRNIYPSFPSNTFALLTSNPLHPPFPCASTLLSLHFQTSLLFLLAAHLSPQPWPQHEFKKNIILFRSHHISRLPKCTSRDGPGRNRYHTVAQLPPGAYL